MVQGRNFNLNSLDAIPAKEADLSVSILLPLWLTKFESNEPLNLRLDFRLGGIGHDPLDVEVADGKARSVITCVNSLDFFESRVGSSLLFQERQVVAWSHLSVRVVAGIRQVVALAYRVEQFYRLVGARSHY